MNDQYKIKLVNRKDTPYFWLIAATVFFLIVLKAIDYGYMDTAIYIFVFSLLFIIAIAFAANSYKATEVDFQLRKMSHLTGFFGPERRSDFEIEPLDYIELFSKTVSVRDEDKKKSRLQTFTGVNVVGAETFEFCLLPEFSRAKRYGIRLAKRLNCPLVDQVNDKGYLPEEFHLSLGEKIRAKKTKELTIDDEYSVQESVNANSQDSEMSFCLPMLHNNSYYSLALCTSVLTFLTWISSMYSASYKVAAVSLMIFIWAFKVFLRHHKAKSLEHNIKITSTQLCYQSGVLGKHVFPLSRVEDLYLKGDELYLLTNSQDIIINFKNNKELMNMIHELLLAHFKVHG